MKGRRLEYPQYLHLTKPSSEEPLPTNPVPALVSAKVTITWSEEDIWLVIVDSDEKDRCSSAPSPFFDMCNSRDVQATAGGIENNNIDGFCGMLKMENTMRGLDKKIAMAWYG